MNKKEPTAEEVIHHYRKKHLSEDTLPSAFLIVTADFEVLAKAAQDYAVIKLGEVTTLDPEDFKF